MKRLILLSIFLFTVSFLSAANKMSMVTYFPVPYVAYSQVSVDQQLDVGLTNTCTMNLGCRESDKNLNANTVNLKSGKLELNQGKGVLGNSITLGSGSGNGQIKFSNVRIQGGTVQSVNAEEMNVKELKLFGHKFPPCRGKGGSDGQMHWTPLSLKGAEGKNELYLVCGNITPSKDPEPEPDDKDSYYFDKYGVDKALVPYTFGLCHSNADKKVCNNTNTSISCASPSHCFQNCSDVVMDYSRNVQIVKMGTGGTSFAGQFLNFCPDTVYSDGGAEDELNADGWCASHGGEGAACVHNIFSYFPNPTSDPDCSDSQKRRRTSATGGTVLVCRLK